MLNGTFSTVLHTDDKFNDPKMQEPQIMIRTAQTELDPNMNMACSLGSENTEIKIDRRAIINAALNRVPLMKESRILALFTSSYRFRYTLMNSRT